MVLRPGVYLVHDVDALPLAADIGVEAPVPAPTRPDRRLQLRRPGELRGPLDQVVLGPGDVAPVHDGDPRGPAYLQQAPVLRERRAGVRYLERGSRPHEVVLHVDHDQGRLAPQVQCHVSSPITWKSACAARSGGTPPRSRG